MCVGEREKESERKKKRERQGKREREGEREKKGEAERKEKRDDWTPADLQQNSRNPNNHKLGSTLVRDDWI